MIHNLLLIHKLRLLIHPPQTVKNISLRMFARCANSEDPLLELEPERVYCVELESIGFVEQDQIEDLQLMMSKVGIWGGSEAVAFLLYYDNNKQVSI
jgi:hypothetical protein